MGVTKRQISAGNGTKPKVGDTVVAHYTGTLANGNVFDSSHKRGRPFRFKVGMGQGKLSLAYFAIIYLYLLIFFCQYKTVIRGWDEGFLDMEIGEKAVLQITSDYAYGASGAGGVIPPNADLTFEVELLGIE